MPVGKSKSTPFDILDDGLKENQWLLADRSSVKDNYFNAPVSSMAHLAEWLISPTRKNVTSYFKKMKARDTNKATTAEGVTVRARDQEQPF